MKNNFFTRQALCDVGKVTLIVFISTLMICVPARLGQVFYEMSFGRHPLQVFVTGFAHDLRYFAFVTWVVFLTVKRFSNLANFARVFYIGWLFILAFMMIGAIEFKIQRGQLPDFEDFLQADVGFAKASWSILFAKRYQLGLLIDVGLAFWLWRLTSQKRLELTWPSFALQSLLVTILSIVGFQVYLKSARMFSSIRDREEYRSPVETFLVVGNIMESGRVTQYLKSSFQHENLGRGLNLFGFSEANLLNLTSNQCDIHPFSTELFPKENQKNSEYVTNPEAFKIAEAIRQLSATLFSKRDKRPVYVWHLMLESFRSDDVAAIEPKASEAITPFLNELFRTPEKRELYSISARNMYGAGVRTAEGLAANQCGWGTMPYDIKFTRHLTYWPLRCLSDVLHDSGFDSTVNYGSNLTFDNMLHFFNSHNTKTREERDVKNAKLAPRGGWGLSDRALIKYVVENVKKNSQTPNNKQAHYNFIISLTNHSPYSLPTDMPAGLMERVRQGVQSSGHKFSSEEMARLHTVAYTDFAVEELFKLLNENGLLEDSIVLVGGDHSVPDLPFWISVNEETAYANAVSRIPFGIVFSKRFSNSPLTTESIELVKTFFDAQAFSENDIPHILLQLLSESSQLKSLSAEKQFHTMPAQRMSPYFRVSSYPSAATIGIDSTSFIYMRSLDAGLLMRTEPLRKIKSLDEVGTSGLLKDGGNLMKAFEQTFLRRCVKL